MRTAKRRGSRRCAILRSPTTDGVGTVSARSAPTGRAPTTTTPGRFRGYAERRAAEIEREIALAEAVEAPALDDSPTSPAQPAGVEDHGSPDEEDEAPTPRPPPTVLSDADRGEPDLALLSVGVTSGSLGLAALGVAIGLALASGASADALLDRLGPMPTLVRGSSDHQRLEEARLQADVATGMYVASAGLLALSATLIIVSVVPTRAGASVAVELVPTGSGAVLRGRF